IGYVDTKGNWVIKPKYSRAVPFCENLAAVVEDGVHGYIDKTGKMVIKLQEDCVHNLDFSEGLAAVSFGKERNEVYGYVDRTGTIVIAPKYREARSFQEGLASVSVKGSKEYDFIDKTGKVVFSKVFHRTMGFSEGLVGCGDMDKKVSDFVDAKGNVVFSIPTGDPSGFHEGLLDVNANDEAYFVDKTGKRVLGKTFQEARKFSSGCAKVKEKGKYGYIDLKGAYVVEPCFTMASDFSDGFGCGIDGDGISVVSAKGIVATIKGRRLGAFDIPFFSCGLASFREGETAVVFDGEGKIVFEAKLAGLWMFTKVE
ncbi:MAG: WG repeat-containing protein, partial [Candidatus Brocadiia bacterium]